MNRKHTLANSILWATAIVASAIMGAPTFFTLVLLPVLAATALLITYQVGMPLRGNPRCSLGSR